MKIGYVRISSEDQNTARQDTIMRDLGVEKVFVDKQSGKNTNRPQLNELLSFIREGDTVIVESISRFARNTADLLRSIEILQSKKVEFVSKKETIDTTTATGKFMLTVFAAIAELERETTRQRQAEGIIEAKKNGVYKGRQPIKIDSEKFATEYKLFRDGLINAETAMDHLGLKSNTFYRRVKQYEQDNNIEPSAIELNKQRRKG